MSPARVSKNIVITGTHLTPALEFIDQLKSDKKIKWHIFYIGRRSNSNDNKDISIESQIIPNLGIEYYDIDCGKFDRRFLPNTINGIPKTISGFLKSAKIIKKIKPDIIVSFGGYVSVPVIINSRLQRINSITHEQTLTNSLATKINSLFVNKIALSFDNPNQIKQLNPKKIVITGNLLRSQLFNSKGEKPTPKISTKKPIIYITAGNQGSHTINSTIKKILPILNNYQIIHQTGKNDYLSYKKLEKKYPSYFVFDYLKTPAITWILKNCSIIISRSGANTSQEIAAFNLKSIIIPLPKSQQNEQLLNAKWLYQQLPQSTIIIDQNKLNSKNLLQAISQLISTPSKKKIIVKQNNLSLLKLIHEIV